MFQTNLVKRGAKYIKKKIIFVLTNHFWIKLFSRKSICCESFGFDAWDMGTLDPPPPICDQI
jgi:hypothetical protein